MLGRRLAWWFVANLLCLVGLSSAQWFPAVLKLFTTTTSVSQGEDADDAVIKGPKRESRSYWRRHAKQIFFMQTATSDQSSNERVDQGLYVSNADVELYRERKRLLAKELQSQVEDREVDNYANPSTSSNARLRGRQNWPQFLKALPEVSLRCDPVINFKLKQRLSYLGACVTVGLDYLSDLAQWRAFCAVEDTLLHGRFSLKGSELSWAKSFHINLGLGEDAAAKFKLRCGYNLNTHKVYARLRFRAEPLSCFDIAEGISAAGKLPLPGLLPLLRTVPLRIEYRLRINTPSAESDGGRGPAGRKFRPGNGDAVHFSTGIDKVEISLDELNFCLEWDERAPIWDIGISKPGRNLGSRFQKNRNVVVKPESSSSSTLHPKFPGKTPSGPGGTRAPAAPGRARTPISVPGGGSPSSQSKASGGVRR